MAKFDVTTNKRSIAGQLEEFIQVMNNHTLPEIKDKVKSILVNEDTVVSTHTKNKWMHELERQKSKVGIMSMISNLYLKAADLGVSK